MELPVWNWWKAIETKDLRFILRKGETELNSDAIKAFELLQDEFIFNFGINDNHKKYIDLRCRIELQYIQQVLSGDRSNQLIINLLENELNFNFGQEKEANYFNAVIALERWGIKVDIMDCSVYVFYNYLNELKKWQKAKK